MISQTADGKGKIGEVDQTSTAIGTLDVQNFLPRRILKFFIKPRMSNVQQHPRDDDAPNSQVLGQRVRGFVEIELHHGRTDNSDKAREHGKNDRYSRAEALSSPTPSQQVPLEPAEQRRGDERAQ